MKDDFAAVESGGESAGIADVGLAEFDRGGEGREGVAAMKIVEDQDLASPIRREPPDQMGADEPGAARDKNFHFSSILWGAKILILGGLRL
jgi:hypothetical protein